MRWLRPRPPRNDGGSSSRHDVTSGSVFQTMRIPVVRKAMRATLIDILRDRGASRAPTLVNGRDRFTTRAFRREQNKLIQDLAKLWCEILSLRVAVAGEPYRSAASVADDAVAKATDAIRKHMETKSLAYLTETIEAHTSEVDSLRRQLGGSADQSLRGGVMATWEKPTPATPTVVSEPITADSLSAADRLSVGDIESRPDRLVPRVPKRLKDLTRWRTTWPTVKSQYERGEGYLEMARWLEKTHPKLAVSSDVLADIIRAGVAGKLADEHRELS